MTVLKGVEVGGDGGMGCVDSGTPGISPKTLELEVPCPASWHVTVPKSAAGGSELRFAFGDGEVETQSIPVGTGTTQLMFKHPFSEEGEYNQTATIANAAAPEVGVTDTSVVLCRKAQPQPQPEAQTVPAGVPATWVDSIQPNPTTPMTISFDPGDGTPAHLRTVPAGDEVVSFLFSHTFSATGAYKQSARILETGAESSPATTLVTVPGAGAGASGPWGPQNSGTDKELLGVDCTDANTCVAVGMGGTIRRTTDGGTTWLGENSVVFTAPLLGVSCPGTTTCFAVGMVGTILKRSAPGGVATWTPQSFAGSGSGIALHDVDCPSTTTCFAVGKPPENPIYLGGPQLPPTIIATTNGGSNWTTQTAPGIVLLHDVDCLDALSCVASGYFGSILKTKTGGLPWIRLQPDAEAESANFLSTFEFADVRGVTCVSSLNCIAVDAAGRIRATINGGLVWTTVASVGVALQSVSCADASNCFAVGDEGKVRGSTDGGQTWATVASGTTKPLNRVSCVGGATVTCVAVGVSGTIVGN